MPDRDLVDHVVAGTGLTRGEATRVIEDVLAYYREPVDDVVRRRHAHHRLYGVRGDAAYRAIQDDLADRLVAPPALTQRQIRRIIYG